MDRANLLVTVAAGMFWQIQSDICTFRKFHFSYNFYSNNLIQFHFLAEPSGAPLLSKLGNLSIREILVVTSAYARPPARPSVQTLGEGERKSKTTRRETEKPENRENERCFWAIGVFLAGKSHDRRRF